MLEGKTVPMARRMGGAVLGSGTDSPTILNVSFEAISLPQLAQRSAVYSASTGSIVLEIAPFSASAPLTGYGPGLALVLETPSSPRCQFQATPGATAAVSTGPVELHRADLRLHVAANTAGSGGGGYTWWAQMPPCEMPVPCHFAGSGGAWGWTRSIRPHDFASCLATGP